MVTVKLICLFSVCSFAAMAQTGATATLLGTITDSSGAVATGVNVTAVNIDTNLTRSSVTDSSGNYTIFSLPIGRYDIRANLAGF